MTLSMKNTNNFSIDSDIVFLQETHSSVDDEKFCKNQWCEHAWFSSHSSNSRGVSILICNSAAPKFHSLFSDPALSFGQCVSWS